MRARACSTLLFMGRVFTESWGGVREFSETLLRALAPAAAGEGRELQVLVPRAGVCPVAAPGVREVVLPRFAASRFLWDHWTVRRHANAQAPGVVLYNPKAVLPPGLRIPGFVSIYDFMYFPQPDRYDWREYRPGESLYMRWMIRSTVARAGRIHLTSFHSLADARRIFPEAPEPRFAVAHPGVDADFWGARAAGAEPEETESWLAASGVRPPYVFYAGGLSRRKNVARLVRAFASFRRAHPEFQLVLTGGAKPTTADPELGPLLRAAERGGIIRLGAVARPRLRLLYQRAHFSVFPSLYEGFGFPPAESQAAGCPVIASSASSIPEVVGETALVFDPRDERALLECMERMLDPDTRKGLIEAGLRNVARFEPAALAREILRLADECACV